MNAHPKILGISVFFATALCLEAQYSLGPMTTFGFNGDGWWAPGENGYAYLTTSGNERAIAYGNVGGNNYLFLGAGAGSTPTVRVLNPLTGVEVGFLDMTGITGGARLLVGLGVSADGKIYGANLQTALSDSAPYKVYRWDSLTASPTLVYSGNPLNGARLGDSFDVFGSGSATRWVAGYAATPAISGNNGYVVVDPTAGTATHIAFSGTPPAAGDFRLGITFAGNATTVIGDQGNVVNDTRYTTYSGGVGTLVATLTLTSPAERQMDYTIINGIPYLATVETTSAASGSTTRVYDMSNPLTPILVATGKLATTANSNGNGTGGVAWGDSYFDTVDQKWKAALYSMNSNNGLQAFVFVIPEPSTMGLTALGALLAAWALRRRHP